MRLTRPAAVLFVILACAPSLSAQQRRPGEAVVPAPRETTPLTAVTGASAEETRRDLEDLLKQYPPSLPRILRLDPSLLSSAEYLKPYPALGAFLAQHPEVPHNPSYFFAAYDGNYGDSRYRLTPQERSVDIWRNAIEGFMIGVLLLGVGSGLIWLVKTLIEHRRWSRLSKIQTEVHNKLLDRFTANEDLLAYIQTPAGRRFLESAPIPLDAPRAMGAPVGRILWSAQAGGVLTVLGAGVALVSRNALEEVATPLSAFGVVIIALGLGFLVSAVIAYVLTRRFGLLNAPGGAQDIHG